MKIKILWLSRHMYTQNQKEELKRLFGKIEIVSISQTVKNAQEVIEIFNYHQCNEMVVVLPPAILAALCNPRISPVKPIRAVMDRVPTGTKNENGEDEFNFVFSHFERIERIEVVTTRL